MNSAFCDSNIFSQTARFSLRKNVGNQCAWPVGWANGGRRSSGGCSATVSDCKRAFVVAAQVPRSRFACVVFTARLFVSAERLAFRVNDGACNKRVFQAAVANRFSGCSCVAKSVLTKIKASGLGYGSPSPQWMFEHGRVRSSPVRLMPPPPPSPLDSSTCVSRDVVQGLWCVHL